MCSAYRFRKALGILSEPGVFFLFTFSKSDMMPGLVIVISSASSLGSYKSKLGLAALSDVNADLEKLSSESAVTELSRISFFVWCRLER